MIHIVQYTSALLSSNSERYCSHQSWGFMTTPQEYSLWKIFSSYWNNSSVSPTHHCYRHHWKCLNSRDMFIKIKIQISTLLSLFQLILALMHCQFLNPRLHPPTFMALYEDSISHCGRSTLHVPFHDSHGFQLSLDTFVQKVVTVHCTLLDLEPREITGSSYL